MFSIALTLIVFVRCIRPWVLQWSDHDSVHSMYSPLGSPMIRPWQCSFDVFAPGFSKDLTMTVFIRCIRPWVLQISNHDSVRSMYTPLGSPMIWPWPCSFDVYAPGFSKDLTMIVFVRCIHPWVLQWSDHDSVHSMYTPLGSPMIWPWQCLFDVYAPGFSNDLTMTVFSRCIRPWVL